MRYRGKEVGVEKSSAARQAGLANGLGCFVVPAPLNDGAEQVCDVSDHLSTSQSAVTMCPVPRCPFVGLHSAAGRTRGSILPGQPSLSAKAAYPGVMSRNAEPRHAAKFRSL